jgi:hypothetical protein
MRGLQSHNGSNSDHLAESVNAAFAFYAAKIFK